MRFSGVGGPLKAPRRADFRRRWASSSLYSILSFLIMGDRPMKRPAKGRSTPVHHTRDVKQDFSRDQLAAVGAVTLAFNELQSTMEAMLQVSTGIPEWLFSEVGSRIHGLDGKIA